MKPPQLAFAGFVTQRLEGNSDFYSVAILRYDSLRLHHDVDTEIIIPAFSHNSVLLHAKRIKEKLIRSALVVESVQDDADQIVIENRITLRDGGAYFARIVVSVKREVNEFGVIPGKHFSPGGRRRGVAGPPLIKVFEDCRLLPNFIVQLAINYRRFIKTRDPHRRFLFWRQSARR